MSEATKDPLKAYQKLKTDMVELKNSLVEKLGEQLKTAQETLNALKEMGFDAEALATPTISDVVAMFAPKQGKKGRGSGVKRFSAKQAKKALGKNQMTIADLATVLKLSADVVKTNLEKPDSGFAVTGDKVKSK